jgi:hypothetical protein
LKSPFDEPLCVRSMKYSIRIARVSLALSIP